MIAAQSFVAFPVLRIGTRAAPMRMHQGCSSFYLSLQADRLLVDALQQRHAQGGDCKHHQQHQQKPLQERLTPQPAL
jgi:hypothetical protein